MALYDDERGYLPPPSTPVSQGTGGSPAPAAGPIGGTAPIPAQGVGSQPIGGGGGGWNLPAVPNFAIPGAPVYSAPRFMAPTMDSVRNSPGFQLRLDQGRKALEASAAAKGVLRSGGTLQDILTNGQALTEDAYQNAFNREMASWQAASKAASDEFAPKFAHWQIGADAARQAGLARYSTDLSHALQAGAPAGPGFDELGWALGGDFGGVPMPQYGGGGYAQQPAPQYGGYDRDVDYY